MGRIGFLLIDLPPGTGDIHLSIIQEVPVTGAVIVSTPQHVALADVRKGIAMFQMESINIPVLGLIENMAYFTPEEFLTINIISLETREHNIWQKIWNSCIRRNSFDPKHQRSWRCRKTGCTAGRF
jgi:MinD-like ATPase involved in chromosome partitioning or flagellar assembly